MGHMVEMQDLGSEKEIFKNGHIKTSFCLTSSVLRKKSKWFRLKPYLFTYPNPTNAIITWTITLRCRIIVQNSDNLPTYMLILHHILLFYLFSMHFPGFFFVTIASVMHFFMYFQPFISF